MLTGMREAIRVFHMLKGEEEFGKAAAALVDKDAVRKRKKVISILERCICGGQAQSEFWNLKLTIPMLKCSRWRAPLAS